MANCFWSLLPLCAARLQQDARDVPSAIASPRLPGVYPEVNILQGQTFSDLLTTSWEEKAAVLSSVCNLLCETDELWREFF